MWSALVLLSVIGCAVAGPPISRSRADIESFKLYLENSRRDDGTRLDSRMLANPKAAVWENSGKFQGDIILDDEQVKFMVDEYSAGRSAYIVANTKWPSNTVIYEFAPGFTQAQINAIYAAMRDISARTCIRFRRRNGERDYVRITGRSDGCYAHVGFWRGRGLHIFNLALNTPGRGCFTPTVIIHEWLHVVGFMHMHSTHNRDSWVRIMWQNIVPGYAYAFDKYGTNTVHNMGLPYEYSSVMHYDRWGFSTNGQATMMPLYDDRNQMGQRSHVTAWDWLRANRHYNCPGAWTKEINVEEMNKGVNEDEYLPEQDTAVEDIVVDDTPQEEIVDEEASFVEDAPQEEILDEKVSFVEDAPQDQ